MPDTQPPQSEARDRAMERRIHWDAVAAIIASLVGLLALIVAGYTAYIQRQQVRAQVWPYLEVGESDSLPTDVLGGESHGGLLVAINKGVGPAIVHGVEVRVDGKAQSDWDSTFAALGFQKSPSFSMSSFNHSVLSPGEQLDFMAVVGTDQWGRFKSQLGRRLIVRACYCSALGECWTSTLGSYTSRHWGQPVKDCPVTPQADQFKD